MRILITGGAGCLGSNLIEKYLPKGHKIFVIDNFATGHREVLPEIDGLTVKEGSIADKGLVDSCFDNFSPEYVIHSAASYKKLTNWSEDTATNVQGTINIVDASLRLSVKKVINFQTALCYGRPQKIPIPIDHPVAPFTSYGISKTAGEQYLAMSSVNFVSLRLANITGPRLSIGPIPTFYTRLKAGQSCFCSDTTRDFLDITDFFRLMDILLTEGSANGIYNVSTGEGHTIKDVFDVIVEHLGITLDNPVLVVPPGDDDVPVVVLDPTKAEDVFGWKAQVNFRDSIKRMLQWYDKYGVNEIYSHLKSGA